MLIGNIGSDVRHVTFKNGGECLSFSLATSTTWRDKVTHEKKERVEWHSINIKNTALTSKLKDHLRKGMKIYLEGSLETEKYTDKDNIERTITKVAINQFDGEVKLLDKPPNQGCDYDEIPF
jgi:single-strand DNA-binding protein